MLELNVRVDKKLVARIALNTFLWFFGLFSLWVIDGALGLSGWLVGFYAVISIWVATVVAYCCFVTLTIDRLTTWDDALAGLWMFATILASPILSAVWIAQHAGPEGWFVAFIVCTWATYAVSFLLYPAIPAVIEWLNRRIDDWVN